MTRPQKFLFDNSFDAPIRPRVRREPEPEPEPPEPEQPPEPTYTASELEAACRTARAEGEQAGRDEALAEAAQSREQALLDVMQHLNTALTSLMAQAEERKREAAQETLKMSRAALRRLFPALAAREGETEIVALLSECLGIAREEPRVVVRVADRHLDTLREQLASLQEATGYEGRVVLLADADLGPSDLRVEWADGGVERMVDRTTKEIDKALQRALMATSDTEQPSEEPNDGPE